MIIIVLVHRDRYLTDGLEEATHIHVKAGPDALEPITVVDARRIVADELFTTMTVDDIEMFYDLTMVVI